MRTKVQTIFGSIDLDRERKTTVWTSTFQTIEFKLNFNFIRSRVEPDHLHKSAMEK